MYWNKFPADFKNTDTFKKILDHGSYKELLIFFYIYVHRNQFKKKIDDEWFLKIDCKDLAKIFKQRPSRVLEYCTNLFAILSSTDEQLSNGERTNIDSVCTFSYKNSTCLYVFVRISTLFVRDDLEGIEIIDENFQLERKKERKNSKTSFADKSYKNLNSKDQSNGLDRASFEAMFPEVVNELKSNGTWEES